MRHRLCIALLVGFSILVPAARADGVLDTLKQGHPRLFLHDSRLSDLKARHDSDPALQRVVDAVIKDADNALNAPPLERELIGPRLLRVSRNCLHRVKALALAYRWTGKEAYAKAALNNMRTVCAFEDWNPSHFLDVAEMTHAVGLGYDWLYGYMDAETRAAIREGLIKRGIKPGIEAYESHWFPHSDMNWNQVCNGGLLVGALAIAESEPDYARQIVNHARESLPVALASYAPDGAWPEGPNYWHYATRYTAFALSALGSALGTDFGLSEKKGMDETGLFPILTTGPTGRYFCFADAGLGARRGPMGVMFWLGRTYQDQRLIGLEHQMLKDARPTPDHLIWYTPPSGNGKPQLPLDYLFEGPVPVAVMRSGWDSPDALFAAIKSGYNQVNHGHLDLGNFELDALGVRWAVDLGSDDYNLPGYWEMEPAGQRWSYFRLNSHGHNVLTVNGESQDARAEASITGFGDSREGPYCTVDLSSAYAPSAESARRGIALVDERRAVLVQDEVDLQDSASVTWGMITEADISIEPGGHALLRQDGEQLSARILAPANAVFSVEPAEQEPPQATNKGYKRLEIRLGEAEGEQRIAVLLAPHWDDGEPSKPQPLRPLSEWETALDAP